MRTIHHICILGGTGFVGQSLVARLAKTGRTITVLTRRPERHRSLQVNPGVKLIKADIHDEETLVKHFRPADAVINLVGILAESRRHSFYNVHFELARKVMQSCWKADVTRLLHMSALNADAGRGASMYLHTKGEAEDMLHVDAGDDLHVTRFRPSVIYGSNDSFFNRFASLLRLSPVVFPLACPKTRFAPVYVEDVAEAFVATLEDKSSFGQRYDLCGPQSYTLNELVTMTAEYIGSNSLIIPLGNFFSQLQAFFLGMLPGKPFTLDNYHTLQFDSVCEENGLIQLGIQPAPLEVVVPRYLGRSFQRAKYDEFRKLANRDEDEYDQANL
ncbi:MAG: complex I NDUFA9 subunit family protein [Gammaproteobacteria bacterium]|nr:MAG: complex I NDUFA9 subunit family protein [Gammaproteobacteria bacterium]